MSPSAVRMTFFVGTAGSTFCKVVAKFSTITIAFAPESFS